MCPLLPAVRPLEAAQWNDQQWLQAIVTHLQGDTQRMALLQAAANLNLNQWCLAAGFVRNAVWDYCHGYVSATPLNDIDLIYFDPDQVSEQRDLALERQVKSVCPGNWSVKNQARMHTRNGHAPYGSMTAAMSFWPELETAVGAYIHNGELRLVSPYELPLVLSNSITLNPKQAPELMLGRMAAKRWCQTWPSLNIRT